MVKENEVRRVGLQRKVANGGFVEDGPKMAVSQELNSDPRP